MKLYKVILNWWIDKICINMVKVANDEKGRKFTLIITLQAGLQAKSCLYHLLYDIAGNSLLRIV